MNTQQAESFIAFPYLDDFRTVGQEIIKDENILWAGNVAQFQASYENSSCLRFGYLVITQEKLIRVLFQAEYDDYEVGNLLADLFWPVALVGALLTTEKPTLGTVRPHNPKKKRQEITMLRSDHQGHSHGSSIKVPPATPLTNDEATSRAARVFPITNLTSIDRFESQDDHTGEKIIEFDIKFVPDEIMRVVFYKEQDARIVYDLLLTHLQGNAKSSQQVSAITEQLEKLAELHKAQVLNDVEFETAKKRLLEK